MGIVHHSNYLRFLEEARVFWLRQTGLDAYHGPDRLCLFAVTETRVRHLKPLYFEDQAEIWLESRCQGARIFYQYQIFSQRFTDPILKATTEHVAVDKNMKLIRLPNELREKIGSHPWTETWL